MVEAIMEKELIIPALTRFAVQFQNGLDSLP